MSSPIQQLVGAEDEPRAALDEVFTRLYSRIRLLAARIRWDGANPTLNPTTLVHEAYLKLQKSPPDLASKSYEEVAAIFAQAMRQILMDAARRKGAQKRGAGEVPEKIELPIEDAILLNTAFQDLRLANERQARVFECRFFLGMTCDETAAALGLSRKTAERDWQEGRQYIANRLRPTAE